LYIKKIEFDDFFGKKREQEVHFNLTSHEVFKLLVEFQAIFEWTEKMQDRDPNGKTDTAEVIEFYNNVEEIILAAWGQPDPDGLHFRKGGVYDFKESALFHKCMQLFVEDPAEANKLVDGLMPKDLQDIVKRADANLAELAKSGSAPEDLQAKIDELMAQKAAADAGTTVTPITPGAQTVPGQVVVG
jgi:hypothetical protein